MATDLLAPISENGLFKKIFSNPHIKNDTIENVMEPSYPLVEFNTPVEKAQHPDQ
jgi:cystathionine beta-synthase